MKRKLMVLAIGVGMVGCASAPIKIPLQYPISIQMNHQEYQKDQIIVIPVTYPKWGLLYRA